MHLADWMKNQGFDDDKVAELAGVDRVTISRTRRRITRPSPSLLAALYRVSEGQITANDFFHVDEAAEEPTEAA